MASLNNQNNKVTSSVTTPCSLVRYKVGENLISRTVYGKPNRVIPTLRTLAST
jgi:hypothetical protein